MNKINDSNCSVTDAVRLSSVSVWDYINVSLNTFVWNTTITSLWNNVWIIVGDSVCNSIDDTIENKLKIYE